jgi:alkaline phosphatase
MKKTFSLIALLLLTLCRANAQEAPQSNVYIPAPGQPKNIILLLGDGMGITQLTAGMLKNGDTLHMERFQYTGLVKTWSKDNATLSTADAVSTIATGKQSGSGYLGLGPNGKPLKSLMEYAKEKQMALGMVVTSSVTHPSAAAFVAHVPKWDDEQAIALDFVKLEIDILIGGGAKYFNETRPDKRNLLQEFQKKGYELEDNEKKVGKLRGDKILALVANEGLLDYTKRKDYLPKATENAMQMLYGKSGMGFFLVIEGSQIDWASRGNDLNYLTGETIDFDKAVGKALDYFGKNKETLIIVLGTNETGGMAITEGDPSMKDIKAKWVNNKPTADLVPIFAVGPGAEQFTGIQDNKEIFQKILNFIQAR